MPGPEGEATGRRIDEEFLFGGFARGARDKRQAIGNFDAEMVRAVSARRQVAGIMMVAGAAEIAFLLIETSGDIIARESFRWQDGGHKGRDVHRDGDGLALHRVNHLDAIDSRRATAQK